jgi:hypothetical protein
MFMYSYNLNNFPNRKYNLDRLTKEISDSSITIALDHLNGGGDSVLIFFKAELSVAEKSTLDLIIANHSGEILPNSLEVMQVKVVAEQPKYIESGNVTQEFFCAETILVDVSANDTLKVVDISWPFNISLKSGTIHVNDAMIGDELSIEIAPNTVIGAITSNLNVGDTSINVNSTVIQNIKYGFYTGLYPSNHEIGRVTSVGSNYITFAPGSDVSANAGSPIYMCSKVVPYVYFNAACPIDIGKTLTTANRIPKGTKVRIKYKNNTSTAKKVSFFVEYLY